MLIFSMSNTILAGDFFIGLGLTSVTTLNLAPQQFIENVMEVINSEFLYTGWLFPLESKDDFLGVKLSFFS